MNLNSNDISQWANTLTDFHPEYREIKVWSPVQFYELSGRKSTIAIDNYEPLRNLRYTVYVPAKDRYYFKTYPDIPLWLLMFYKTDKDWDSYDVIVNNLRLYIADKNIYLLLTPEQVTATTEKLKKLWSANLEGTGQLSYKTYVQIADLTLQYEDYKNLDKRITGYATVCRQFEDKIAGLWKSAYDLKR